MDMRASIARHNHSITAARHGTASDGNVKKKEMAAGPAFASITASDIVRAPTVQRTVAVDFLPLIKPFKRSGRLALRVERLPQRARLSAGRRNSDGSWSLASDELEDLTYLIPSNIVAAHELTVRVMKFDDGAASTLKLIQYPIAAWDDVAELAGEKEAVSRPAETDDPILRNQLGEMQSLFAVRESELAELRAALEKVREEKAAELAKARTAWEQELHQKLAEVATQVSPVQAQVQAQVQSDKKQRDRETRQAEQDSQKRAEADARAEQRIACGARALAGRNRAAPGGRAAGFAGRCGSPRRG